jgi:hypothetical protein
MNKRPRVESIELSDPKDIKLVESTVKFLVEYKPPVVKRLNSFDLSSSKDKKLVNETLDFLESL